MKFHTKIILFLNLTIYFSSYSQKQAYYPQTTLAIETYVFLKAQSAALEVISEQYPALRPAVATLKKRSESFFGRATVNIEQFLQSELQTSQYKLIQNEVDFLIKQQLSVPIEKEEYAQDYLRLAYERSFVMTNTSLYKEIMAFKYHDIPHQEITDGHLDVFTNTSSSKAGKSDFKIPVPKSWLAEETEIPETIQQFTSFNGRGLERIILMIIDLPEENKNLILNQKSITEMMPPQATLIRSETILIDDRSGMMVEVEENIQTSTAAMKVRMLQFMCIYDGKLYSLQGSIGPVHAERNLALHLKKYEPLFRLIVSKTEIGN